MGFKNFVKKIKFPFPIELLKWVLIDKYRKAKGTDGMKSFTKYSGIYIITGKTGGGKTTVAVALIDDYIRRFGRENIYIASNTYFADQDFQVRHWGDLTLFYNKPLLFIYDECNADFPQNAYKNIDRRLRSALAQNRKGEGKAIFAISQDYSMLLNEFRRLSKGVWWSKTLFNRWTRSKMYDTMEFEEMISTPDVSKKMKARPYRRIALVQTDEFRKRYDSYALVHSIKHDWDDYYVRKELLDKIDYTMTDISEYKVESDLEVPMIVEVEKD